MLSDVLAHPWMNGSTPSSQEMLDNFKQRQNRIIIDKEMALKEKHTRVEERKRQNELNRASGV